MREIINHDQDRFPMRGQETDHVISGHPMTQADRQTNKQTDIATLSLNWPSGADSVKTFLAH